MYAFTLWDADKQALLLVRDPFGIKPLYYADNGECIRVASQVKALLASDKVSGEIDPGGVVGFHIFGSVPEPFTCYRAIRAVRAGSSLWIHPDGVKEPDKFCSIREIWANAEQHPQKSVDIASDVREALLDSVRHHLVTDAPIGIFLSGGIESGALLGLIRELEPEREIHTVTLRFKEYEGRPEDESVIAERVAALYGAKHTTRLVTNEELDEDLPRIVEAMDQPSVDGINCWFASKALKESGARVAFSGIGGDELFGGYSSFEEIPRITRNYSIPSRVPFLGDMTKMFGYLLLGNSADPKSLGVVKYGGNYASAWMLQRGVFLPYELKGVLSNKCVNEGLKRLEPMKHIQSAMGEQIESAYPRISAMETALYMRNQLLRDADWAGSAHGLQIRTPLVDCTLLRRLAPLLVAEDEVKGREWVGKAPRPPLPDEVLKRKKTGFMTPMEKWLRKRYEERRPGCRYRPNEHWTRGWARSLAEYLKIT
jgi:asparagine synthase (glutamine-hydrolysing)